MVLEVLEPIYAHALASELHLRQRRLLIARELRHALPPLGLVGEVDHLVRVRVRVGVGVRVRVRVRSPQG